jgi:hypothetical protein
VDVRDAMILGELEERIISLSPRHHVCNYIERNTAI